jgi:hypothetical protein
MSNKPRTPEYFPRMKVRGARRRRLAPYQAMNGSLRRLAVAARSAAVSLTAYSISLNEQSSRERTE